jgi:hypothetical protein
MRWRKIFEVMAAAVAFAEHAEWETAASMVDNSGLKRKVKTSRQKIQDQRLRKPAVRT